MTISQADDDFVRAFDRTPVRRFIRTGVLKSSTCGRHAGRMSYRCLNMSYRTITVLGQRGQPGERHPHGVRPRLRDVLHVPHGHWPTGRADVSTDDRTSRQHQQNSKPESVPGTLRRRSAGRTRASGAADAPQLRSVTPVSQFPEPVTADLTARQKRILEFIRDWVERYGYPPSVREIGEAVGLVSPSSVAYQLKELERKGFLRRDPNRPRAVDVRPPADLIDEEAARARRPTPADVPVRGRSAAGGPLLAEQAVEDVFPLPRELVGEGDVFMLHVKGDSMLEAAICDG